jgi:hypothetical protein
MSLDKYQHAWKAEALRVQVTYDAERLSKEVQQSHDAFRSLIFERHVRVAIAALLMVPIWCAMGYFWSLLWTWYLTVPVLLWIAAFMLVTSLRYSRLQIEPGQPLLVSVKESLAQVEHQLWLMQSSFWWNFMPALASLMVFNLHDTWERSQSWLGFLLVSGGFGVFLFLFYRWVDRTSQLTLLSEFGPRRNELRMLIDRLEGESTLEVNSERADLLAGLIEIETDRRTEASRLKSQAAEVWNRIVPSWREVVLLVLPTLLSAYGAYQYQLEFMKPIAFQASCAACITFTIVFFFLCFLSNRRHKGQPLTDSDDVRYNRPAIVAIVLVVLMMIVAYVAFLSRTAEIKSREVKQVFNLSQRPE